MTYLQEILLRWWYRILILKSIMGAACIRVYIRRLDRVLYQYSVHSGYIYIYFYYASFHRRGVKQPRRKTHSTLLSVIYIVYILFFNKPIICCSISLCLCLSKCAVYVSVCNLNKDKDGSNPIPWCISRWWYIRWTRADLFSLANTSSSTQDVLCCQEKLFALSHY